MTTVGGAFDCDIRVSAPGLVCRLYNHAGDVTLAPATPFSPVLVDGEQVPAAVRLTPGALVTVGRCLMRFVPEGGPGSGASEFLLSVYVYCSFSFLCYVA